MFSFYGWIFLMAILATMLLLYIWIGKRRGYDAKVMGLYLLMTWGFTWSFIRFCKQVVGRYYMPDLPPRDLANYMIVLNQRFMWMTVGSFLIIYGVYFWIILKKNPKNDPLEEKLKDIGKKGEK
ncbi:MAG: hypothetical protein AAFR59_05465 [Bacteroidota bacterium]